MKKLIRKRAERSAVAGIAFTFLFAIGTAARAQTPNHSYDLNGTLTDTYGGPSLTVGSGTSFTANGLNFGANPNLALSSVITSPVYSIETYFKFTDSSSGYRKIIDFDNYTSDNGLYSHNGNLEFYGPNSEGVGAQISSGTMVDVLLTRDSSNNVTGYVNGVQQFTFIDSSNYGVFSGTNNVANFFTDDTVSSGSEASAGYADFIRTYTTALTPTQAAANYAAISGASAPEPAPLSLLLTGILAGGGIRLRRRQTAALHRLNPSDDAG